MTCLTDSDFGAIIALTLVLIASKKMDTDFLKSNRFYAILLAVAINLMQVRGWISNELATTIIVALVGFITVRTADRLGESVGGKIQ
jgi:hypothetical protein